MRAYLEIRKQKAKGKFPRQGPDTYVAVQIVPDDVPKLKYLNHKIAKARGIEIKMFGEGYSSNSGPRSMLGRAIKDATIFIENLDNYKVICSREKSHEKVS